MANQDARPFVDLQKDAEEFRQKFDEDILKCISFLDAKITALICDPDSLCSPSKKNAAKTNAVLEFSKAKYEIFISVKSVINEMEREWLKYISEMKKLFIENVEIFLAGTKLEVKLPTSEFKSSPALGSPLRNKDTSVAEVKSSKTKVAQAQSEQLRRGAAKVSLVNVTKSSSGKATASTPQDHVEEDSSDSTTDSGSNAAQQSRQSRSKTRNEGKLSSSGKRDKLKKDSTRSGSKTSTPKDQEESPVESNTRSSRSRMESNSSSSGETKQVKQASKKASRASIGRVASSSPKKYVAEETSTSESDSGETKQPKQDSAKKASRTSLTRGETKQPKQDSVKKASRTSFTRVASSSLKKYVAEETSTSESDSGIITDQNAANSNTRASRSRVNSNSSHSRKTEKLKQGSAKKTPRTSLAGVASSSPKKYVAEETSTSESDSTPNASQVESKPRASRFGKGTEATSADNTSRRESRAGGKTRDQSQSSTSSDISVPRSKGRGGKQTVQNKSTLKDNKLEDEDTSGLTRSSRSNAVESGRSMRKGKTPVNATKPDSRKQSSTTEDSETESSKSAKSVSKDKGKKTPAKQTINTSSATQKKSTTSEESETESSKEASQSVSQRKGKKAPTKQKLNTSVMSKTQTSKDSNEDSSEEKSKDEDSNTAQRASRRGTSSKTTEVSSPKKSSLMNATPGSTLSRSPKKVTFTPNHPATADLDVITPSGRSTSSVRRKTLLPNLNEAVTDFDVTPRNSRLSNKRKTIGGTSDLANASPPKRLKVGEKKKSASSSQAEDDADDNLLESDGNYSDWMALKSVDAKIPAKPGIYEVKVWRAKKPAYIGQCESLRQKLTLHKLKQNSGHKHLDKFIERNMNDIQIRFETVSSVDVAKNEVKNRVKSFVAQHKTTPAYN